MVTLPRLLALLPALPLLFGSAFAIAPPPSGDRYLEAGQSIFLDNEVTRVDIRIAPGDFQALLDNPWADDYKVVSVHWQNSRIDDTATTVGFRVRGNYSRSAQRKSWKLDFNEFVPERSFHGLEKINLIGESNDPTMIRASLSWAFLRRMGLPASRTHFVALFINGAFWSIQLHVEQVDEEYTNAWFGSKDGNLYKCLYQGSRADLTKVSGEDYAHLGGDSLTYDEQNHAPYSDYTVFRDLIRFLNDSSSATILTDLDGWINVDAVLRALAADVALGNWDDYWYGSNNYFLYRDPNSRRFEWIPFDVDNTLGIDFFSTDWSSRHFDNWGDGGFGTHNPPLVKALFDQSSWRRQYRRYLAQAVAIFRDPAFLALVDRDHALILPWYDGTIESGGVVGFADQGFNANAHELPTSYRGGSYHTIGVRPYLIHRADTLQSQLDAYSPAPPLPPVFINEILPSNSTINHDEAGQYDDWIELYNAGDDAVDLGGMFLTDDPSTPTRWSFPDGTSIPGKGFLVVWADAEESQGPLHASFKLDLAGETVALYDTVENGRALIDWMSFPQLITDVSFGRFPDGADALTSFTVVTPGAANDSSGGPPHPPRTPPRLFINEFMAANTHTFADEKGQFDDWIELYNDEPVAVDLAGLHLTDDLSNPTRFRFPAGTTIRGKGFLVVWADNDPSQGPLHAPFALGKGGEAIGLFDNEDNALQPIHTLVFGPQAEDVSEGLLPDGTGDPVVLASPSPGRSNQPTPEGAAGWILF